jgi:hypothetical protein
LPKKNLFAAGYQEVAGNSKAKVWKNGIGAYLSETWGYLYSEARGVAAKVNNVYVVGDQVTGYGKANATIWLNGVPTILSTDQSSAKAVFVDVNDDVYVAGYVNVSSSVQTGVLWKNNTIFYTGPINSQFLMY